MCYLKVVLPVITPVTQCKSVIKLLWLVVQETVALWVSGCRVGLSLVRVGDIRVNTTHQEYEASNRQLICFDGVAPTFPLCISSQADRRQQQESSAKGDSHLKRAEERSERCSYDLFSV